MTFLNPALALGALAFVVPLVIHILNRSRFKKIDWGAMHLLESVIKVNHKRFRLDQLILLLVRCLIPALLAFCIARPLLTGSKTMEANTPVSLLLVLDGSYSMEASEKGGSKIKQAIEAARELVLSTHRGSDLYVLVLGDQPLPLFDQPVFDAEAVVSRLNNLEGGYGACDLRAALQSSLATLDKMNNAHRELVIISDFQRAEWMELLENGSAEIKQGLEGLDISPTLTLLPIGSPVEGNVSVDSIDFPRKAIGAGEPHAYRVNIVNHGKSARENTRVIFRVNGKEESVSQLTLPAGGSRQVLFTHAFSEPGSQVIEAEVMTDDPLTFDNRFSVSVTVWDRIPVVLVDGDPDPAPLMSETDFLQVALTPFALGRFQYADLAQSSTVNRETLDAKNIDAARVIVLANVSRLSVDQTRQLKTFVANGGVLFVFPGSQIDLKWYREELFENGSGILPAPFGPQKGKDSQPHRIVAQHFEHPSLELFNERSNGDLSDASINRWYLLEETTESGQDPLRKNASVIARLDNADPFLMECNYGKGVVLQMATTCDTDWTDLPRKPVFLPLMQQLVTTTASRMVPPRNLTTGEPVIAWLGNAGESATVTVQTPTGSERVIQSAEQDGQQVADYPFTNRPGIYSLATPEETIRYAVQTDRSESDLRLLDEDQLNSLAEQTGAIVVTSSTEYLQNDQLRRNGSEIWKFVLAGFLGFLFLEMVLQQRFSRARV